MFTAPAYPVRIWLKHYQYRSPEQIERRLLTRRPAMEASTGFLHEVTPNWSTTIATKRDAPLDFEDARPEFAGSRWEERIVPAASLDYDAFDRRYVVNESLMPEFPVRLRRSRLKEMIPESIRTPLGRLRRQILPLLDQLQPNRGDEFGVVGRGCARRSVASYDEFKFRRTRRRKHGTASCSHGRGSHTAGSC